MTIEQLQEENEQIHAINIAQQNDIKQFVSALSSVMSAIGLDIPSLVADDKPMKKIMKAVPNLLLDMQVDPKGLELKFLPLKQLAPMLQKYEHLIESK